MQANAANAHICHSFVILNEAFFWSISTLFTRGDTYQNIILTNLVWTIAKWDFFLISNDKLFILIKTFLWPDLLTSFLKPTDFLDR